LLRASAAVPISISAGSRQFTPLSTPTGTLRERSASYNVRVTRGRRGEPAAVEHATFIVRVARSGDGEITAVVERVRTGEKAKVRALADLGAALAAMLQDPAGPRTQEEGGHACDGRFYE
jgi:hypothetical protein